MSFQARPRAERFWPRVNKDGPVVRPELGACWLWTGTTWGNGYGAFYWEGEKKMGAHRASWVLVHGEIGPGLHVLHHCDNPPCVNPAHLRLGTNDENMADMKARGRSRNGQKKGTHNPHARIDEATVHEIRRLRMEGMTYRGIQAQLGLSNGCVSGVILGTRWAHVPSAKGGAAEQE